jgi:hypothetical protein
MAKDKNPINEQATRYVIDMLRTVCPANPNACIGRFYDSLDSELLAAQENQPLNLETLWQLRRAASNGEIEWPYDAMVFFLCETEPRMKQYPLRPEEF